MASRPLRTSDIAKELGVHPNTVRLYETWGFLPAIPRGKNKYRQYTGVHLEQARLAHLTLRWPYLGDKVLALQTLEHGLNRFRDVARGLELARAYLYRAELAIRTVEHTLARASLSAANSLELTEEERSTLAEEFAHVTETVADSPYEQEFIG
jgi:DNA-binding transcriptional MerR regulator